TPMVWGPLFRSQHRGPADTELQKSLVLPAAWGRKCVRKAQLAKPKSKESQPPMGGFFVFGRKHDQDRSPRCSGGMCGQAEVSADPRASLPDDRTIAPRDQKAYWRIRAGIARVQSATKRNRSRRTEAVAGELVRRLGRHRSPAEKAA